MVSNGEPLNLEVIKARYGDRAVNASIERLCVAVDALSQPVATKETD